MFSSDKWFGASAGFYPETIDQSLRFEDGDSPYLLRTPSSTGNRKTWTISCWLKIANTGLTANIISVFQASSNQTVIRFYQDKLYLYDFGGSYLISTNRVFRDTTNWYHMVWRFDSTQSTASERIKLYINGTQETDLNDNTYPSLNHDSLWNHTNKHLIGARTDNSTPTPIQEFDGYLAEFNLVDGQALGPESFGETKNGVWIPKNLSSISYGTNGFRLTFADSSSLGDDTSGNGNDFTSSGLASTDVVLDSPTNNFSTLNFLAGSTQQASSEGNLRTTASSSGANFSSNRSTIGVKSGKWYAEFRLDVVQLGTGGQDNGTFVGTGSKEYPHDSSNQNGTDNGVTILYTANSSSSSRGIYVDGTLFDSGLDAHSAGDIIGIEMNVDDSEVTFYKNGTKQGNTRGIGSSIDGGFYYFYTYVRVQTASTRVTANFGQDSSFAGQETAGTNTDENGIGLFKYAPSSGYLALCSSNLPDTTISPNQDTQADDHFNTVLYTGNGTADRAIDVGFATDWFWVKQRSGSNVHQLTDSSRGALKGLNADQSAIENTFDSVRSFTSTGVTVGTSATTNSNGATYVAWNWKANGGTTSSNSDGSITSTVQANTTAGFSIVLYTGNGTAGATIGHGLGVKPAMILIKRRTGSVQDWIVYHHKNTSAPATDYLMLNRSDYGTLDADVIFNDTEPDTSVITLGSHNSTNQSSQSHIAYVFAEVEGYSKFGSYTGNSSSDGTFVFTGFRPAWLMVRKTTGADNWLIHDNARDPDNVVQKYLLADSSNAEASDNSVDFLSNGFKWRVNSGARNTSGQTYIYMAFAEQPFKFSNAR